ncbi:MAG: type II toxin-antitoxin system RelE/ParE family toxin [Chitinophagaceae bacterium]|jgi:mRNA interferase RelE/StbE|nr:type II toxin-antitoxin system RelE/ParE family toxin [Chitinophagaceae bacterium]
MNVTVRKTFEKDGLKLPAFIQHRIADLLDELEKANSLSEISNCKKLTGFKNAYRIRIGEYRVGFYWDKSSLDLVRVLARKEMYRFFP